MNDALTNDFNRNNQNELVKKSMKDIIGFYYHYYQNEEIDDDNKAEKETVLRRSERRENMEKDNNLDIINNQSKKIKINKLNKIATIDKNLLNVDNIEIDLKGIKIPSKKKDRFDVNGCKIKAVRGRPPQDRGQVPLDQTKEYVNTEYDSIERTPMENALAYAAMRNKDIKIDNKNSSIVNPKKSNKLSKTSTNICDDKNTNDKSFNKNLMQISNKNSEIPIPTKILKKEKSLSNVLSDKVHS